MTGSSRNPLDMPKRMIPTHILKKTTNMYDYEFPNAEIARKVENPPWKTLDPI